MRALLKKRALSNKYLTNQLKTQNKTKLKTPYPTQTKHISYFILSLNQRLKQLNTVAGIRQKPLPEFAQCHRHNSHKATEPHKRTTQPNFMDKIPIGTPPQNTHWLTRCFHFYLILCS